MDGGLLWLAAAIGSSLLSAQNVEMNRRAKQEGFRLNLWRTALAAIFWLPLALVQDWPTEPLFYAAAVFGGLVLIVGFTIQTDLAVKHNGRVAILHMPLKAVAVFAVWHLIDREALHHVIDYPLKTLGILVCLGIMIAALFSFRKHDVSWSSFKAVLPIVVLYSMGDLFTRMVVSPENLSETLVVFLFVLSATSALASALLLPWRPQPQLPLITPGLMRAGGWAAFGGTMNQVLFFIALVMGPGPSYVSMVALLAPVWLLAYHRLAGIKDDASPVAGMVVVGASIIIMVLSA